MIQECTTMSFDRVCGQYLLSGALDRPLRLYHMGSNDPIAEARTVEEMVTKIEKLEDDLAALRYDMRYGRRELYGLYIKEEEPKEAEPDAEQV